MPLFDFSCKSCSHEFETLVFQEDEQVECPECHGHKLDRLLSTPAKPRETQPMSCPPSKPPCGPGCCRL